MTAFAAAVAGPGSPEIPRQPAEGRLSTIATSSRVLKCSTFSSSRIWNSSSPPNFSVDLMTFLEVTVPVPRRTLRNDQCSGRRDQSAGPRASAFRTRNSVVGASAFRTSRSMTRSVSRALPSRSSRFRNCSIDFLSFAFCVITWVKYVPAITSGASPRKISVVLFSSTKNMTTTMSSGAASASHGNGTGSISLGTSGAT